jgi:hypothetical protein
MTDINEWNINYIRAWADYTVDYDFGSLAQDSPFTVQMEIGDADMVDNDVAHGSEDVLLPGRDQILSSDLTFSLTTVPDPNDPDRMLTALDKVSEFQSVWRGFGMRNIPGRYAVLTNNLRGRSVIGRPRNFSRKHGRGMRRGVIEYIAQFRTITPYWYKFPVNSLSLPIGGPTPQIILGDQPTWPIITFDGPFDTASLTWNPGFFLTPWTITVNHVVADNDQIRIDTRPWLRSIENLLGDPVRGWIAGDSLAKCFMSPTVYNDFLTPGTFTLAATGITDSGTGVTIEWSDTFAGL